MHWSQDGQLLTFSTSSGYMYCHLTKIASLYSMHQGRICYLSSLKEISIVSAPDQLQAAANQQPPRAVCLTTKIEPNFIALGPRHIAAGMNNRVWYYDLQTRQCVNEQEYVGSVVFFSKARRSHSLYKFEISHPFMNQNHTGVYGVPFPDACWGLDRLQDLPPRHSTVQCPDANFSEKNAGPYDLQRFSDLRGRAQYDYLLFSFGRNDYKRISTHKRSTMHFP